MTRLPLFNIAKRGFCTCLPKYNLNTYLGRCGHKCIYCYAVKFPSFTGPTIPRLKLIDQIEDMAKNTKLKLPVMLSDCTDPYQPLEREYQITRKCLESLVKHGFPLLIVTKSDLVVRDINLIKQVPSVVSITITTLNEEKARFWEPNAPSPTRRLKTLERIVDAGIPATARIDPIIPFVNDDLTEFRELVSELAEIGVKQVTASTFKPVRGFFQTLKTLDSTLYKKLSQIYSDGEWILGYKYLNVEKRRKIIEKVRQIVLDYGLNFSSCREGFPELNTTICDGTKYCRKLLTEYT